MEAFVAELHLALAKGQLYSQPRIRLGGYFTNSAFHGTLSSAAANHPSQQYTPVEVVISFTLADWWNQDLGCFSLAVADLRHWFERECLAEELYATAGKAWSSWDFVVDLTHLQSRQNYVNLLSPHLGHYAPLAQLVTGCLGTDTQFQLWAAWSAGEARQETLRQQRLKMDNV